MRPMGRLTVLIPAAVFVCLWFVLFSAFRRETPFTAAEKPETDLRTENENLLKRKPRFAVTSSVQTASFAAYALQLGYTIQKYNDLAAQDAELVLLVRVDGSDAVTAQNISRLETVGWKIRVEEDLEFEGVDTDQIRSRHRHNMNKLHLWNWVEYEKVLFVDADVICKGSFAELWHMPGYFAAAPDVWFDILTDNRFNSGVVLLRPDKDEFQNLVKKVSDPEYHSPEDADQAFLNKYYQFRYFGLPYKYNLNLIMYQHWRDQWDSLWDEAVFVHFTTKKPMWDPKYHCHKGCAEWEPSEYYGQVFKEMLEFYGFEKDIPIYA